MNDVNNISGMSVEQNMFISFWISNGFNATKAYQAMRPDVTDASAAALGSRMLRKVNIAELLAVRGLDASVYIQGLIDGMKAMKTSTNGVTEPDYKARQYYHQALGRLLDIDNNQVITPIENMREKMDSLRERYMVKN